MNCKKKAKIDKRKVYVYGAGDNGQRINTILDYSIDAFIDGNKLKQNCTFDGIKVIDLVQCQRDAIFLVSPQGDLGLEIKELLLQKGIDKNCIILYDDLFRNSSEKYFDLPELELRCDETYIDVGAYDGDTLDAFVKQINGMYNRIIAIEPVKKNAKKILMKKYNNIDLRCVALWKTDEYKELCEIGENCEKSWLSDCGTTIVEVSTLDEVLKNTEVTLIKINTNGSEKEVIEGGGKCISICKPRIAVSIDYIFVNIDEIISSLKKFNPDYRFYLRHYGLMEKGTVLYAV